jgi:hypothetical protein
MEKSPFRLKKPSSSTESIFESTMKHSFLPILLCFISCDRIDRHPLQTCILDGNPVAACEPLIREYERAKDFHEVYSCFLLLATRERWIILNFS